MVGILAIFRNEAPYLREWVAWHILHGVDRFVLYDNCSTDDWRNAIAPFGHRVHVEDWSRPQPCQIEAYQHGIALVANTMPEIDWLAVIDCDEFLFNPRGLLIGEILDQYNEFPAVVANWACFGPSGHDRKPDGLVIDNYTMRTPQDDPVNTHVKSIVKPSNVLAVGTPHHMEYRHGFAVNTARVPTIGPWTSEARWDVLRINHYLTKSRQEWNAKVSRGRADTGDKRDLDEIDQYNWCEVDYSAKLFSKSVHAILEIL